MRGKRALVAASLLVLVFPAVTGSREPSIPQPIDAELFQSVILPKEELSIPQIVEPHIVTHPTNRPKIAVEQAAPKLLATPKPKIVVTLGSSHSVSGKASWYCRAGRSPCRAGYPDTAGADYYAAAGPALRAAIGGVESSTAYKGRVVHVCNTGICVDVKLVDWCQCYYRQADEKLIDLYKDAWDKIVGSGMGRVTVSW